MKAAEFWLAQQEMFLILDVIAGKNENRSGTDFATNL